MNPVEQISANVKTTKDSWKKFRASCVEKGTTSGDVLGYLINQINNKQIDLPLLEKHQERTSA